MYTKVVKYICIFILNWVSVEILDIHSTIYIYACIFNILQYTVLLYTYIYCSIWKYLYNRYVYVYTLYSAIYIVQYSIYFTISFITNIYVWCVRVYAWVCIIYIGNGKNRKKTKQQNIIEYNSILKMICYNMKYWNDLAMTDEKGLIWKRK